VGASCNSVPGAHYAIESALQEVLSWAPYINNFSFSFARPDAPPATNRLVFAQDMPVFYSAKPIPGYRRFSLDGIVMAALRLQDAQIGCDCSPEAKIADTS
jgi:hypothetical protein